MVRIAPDVRSAAGPPRPSARGPALLARIAITVITPILAYVLLRPHTGSDAAALAIAGAVPAAWTVARCARRRRVDPLGVVAVTGFGIALLVAAVTGGSPLLLKVRDAPLVGAIGIACLLSAALGRPLLGPLLHLLGRGRDATSARLTVATAIVGATLTIDAITRVALAVLLQTSTFLAVDHEASWSILGAGMALLWLSRRRM
jgi:hypothetical protein